MASAQVGEGWDLRLGRWQDVLADVECDALICDPPYSARTDSGYRSASDYAADGGKGRASTWAKSGGKRGGGIAMPRSRYELNYKPIDPEWVDAFCAFFTPRTRTWFVVFGDHCSARWFEAALEARDLVVFAPVPWVRVDSAPRFAGDGPANACEWITIARSKGFPEQRGSRPGWYEGSIHGEKIVTGSKPLWLMRAIVRDYSRPGDLVCDPCAGGATTLLAAAMEGRRAVGAEMDPVTHGKAMARLQRGYTPQLQHMERSKPEQVPLLDEAGE